MTLPSFEIGDVVELKSGGFPMTVRSIASDVICCNWADKRSGSLRSYDFAPEMLTQSRRSEGHMTLLMYTSEAEKDRLLSEVHGNA